MDPRSHWDTIYRTKSATEVSWYQRQARLSLELIRGVAPHLPARILDVGGGASTLVDGLLNAGYRAITVLDVSGAAIDQARARLGHRAALVAWQEANILEARLPPAGFDIWHDRAVFHFLIEAADRRRYVEQVELALQPGGHAVIATFAHDGPTRCSGLDVRRYTPEGLHGEFGRSFKLLGSVREEHLTPAGAKQAFVYCVFGHDPKREH